MRTKKFRLLTFAGLLAASFGHSPNAKAVPCNGGEQPLCVYDRFDFFLYDVSPLREISFETLPNGSPSYSWYPITPQDNYTAQGATFSVNAGLLGIGGGPGGITGYFDLHTTTMFEPVPTPAAITVDLVVPTTAIGIHFPGVTTVSIYDVRNNLISNMMTYGGGYGSGQFFGVSSDTPIARAVITRDMDIEDLEAFYFSPIPEPATALFAGFGLLTLARHRRQTARSSSPM